MTTQSFPEIKTDRLALRQMRESDDAVILHLRSDTKINAFIERPEHRKTTTLNQAKAHIEKMNSLFNMQQAITWGITLKGTQSMIGTICLWNFSEDRKTAEVGYDLDLAFQKKGIMSEALKAVLQYGFEKLTFEKIEAYTHTDNAPSKKLLETNGFQYVEDRKDLDNLSNVIFEIRK